MNEQDQQTTTDQTTPSSENITPDDQQKINDHEDQGIQTRHPGDDEREIRERGTGILDLDNLAENIEHAIDPDQPILVALVEEDVIDPEKPVEIDPNTPTDQVTANIQSISSGPKVKQLSTRRVTNKLSHDDLDEMSRNLSRQTLEIVAIEEEKREQNKYYADKIKRLRKQNNVLATKLESGEEEVDVAVEIIFNSPTLGKKTIIRQDTFDAWEEDMTEAEYRLDTLPPNVKVNDGSNDEDEEDDPEWQKLVDDNPDAGTSEDLDEFDKVDPDFDQGSNNDAPGGDEVITLDDSETRPENIFVDEVGEEFAEIKMPGETGDEPPFKPITEQ